MTILWDKLNFLDIQAGLRCLSLGSVKSLITWSPVLEFFCTLHSYVLRKMPWAPCGWQSKCYLQSAKKTFVISSRNPSRISNFTHRPKEVSVRQVFMTLMHLRALFHLCLLLVGPSSETVVWQMRPTLFGHLALWLYLWFPPKQGAVPMVLSLILCSPMGYLHEWPRMPGIGLCCGVLFWSLQCIFVALYRVEACSMRVKVLYASGACICSIVPTVDISLTSFYSISNKPILLFSIF